MDLLDLVDTLERLAQVNRVQWYEHVLRMNNDEVLRRALNLKVVGRRGQE